MPLEFFWEPDHDSESFCASYKYDSGNYFLFSYWAHDHDGHAVNRAQDSFYPSSSFAAAPQSLSQFTPDRGKPVQIQQSPNQTKLRMASNGGSGGDYQAVEANETRRKRINQVKY